MNLHRLLAGGLLAVSLGGIAGCDEETPVHAYRLNADGSILFSTEAGSDAKCANEGSAWSHRMDNSNQHAVLAVAQARENGDWIRIFDTDTCQGGVEIAKVGTYHSGGAE